nr:MAG TPA: scaffold Bacteriophage, scaffolding protein [Caudoviricetes sp.]
MDEEEQNIAPSQAETAPAETVEAEQTATPDVGESGTQQEDRRPAREKYTKEERITHSFKKQFQRQAKRHSAELAEKDRQLNELAARLDRLENPDKYREKTRNDFSTDDDYINHLVQSKLDAILQKSSEEAEQNRARQQELDSQVEEYRDRQQQNIERLYPSESERSAYYSAVKSAIDAGLGKLLDTDPELSQYIMRSEYGPKIMYRLATDRKTVEELFRSTNGLDRQFKIRELERTLSRTGRKPLGRIGQTSERHDTFDSNRSILDYLAKRG